MCSCDGPFSHLFRCRLAKSSITVCKSALLGGGLGLLLSRVGASVDVLQWPSFALLDCFVKVTADLLFSVTSATADVIHVLFADERGVVCLLEVTAPSGRVWVGHIYG